VLTTDAVGTAPATRRDAGVPPPTRSVGLATPLAGAVAGFSWEPATDASITKVLKAVCVPPSYYKKL